MSMKDFETLNDFDELQTYIMREDVITNTGQFLVSHGIDQNYAKHYLSSIIFFKFKSEFPNMNSEFSVAIDNLHSQNNECVKEAFQKFVELFQDWKKKDVKDTLEELDMMKRQTRASSSETEDPDCKQCFQNQENILTIAEDFYKSIDRN